MRVRPLVVAAAALAALSCSDGGRVYLNPAFLAASTDVIDFGAHEVGTETPLTLFLINKGDKALDLQDPKGDTFAGVFSALLPKTFINPAEDAAVRVVFSPSEAKDYETVLTFPNDSQNQPDFKVTLKGKGVAVDPCKGITCHEPPKPACVSSTVSRHYDPDGTCEAGHCDYKPLDETCGQFGCDEASGLCAKDPCIGISCNNPPNPCFLAQGICENGACRYTANNGAVCHDSNPCTINDTCHEGSCDGTPVACNTPPPSICMSAGVLRTYQGLGACDASGNCQYTPTDTPCAHGCENGVCKQDPCAPDPTCNDGNPCTNDVCTASGCQHTPADGASCISPSGACPTGRCTAGQCLSVPNITCQKEVDVDLCGSVDVPGQCTAAGECVVSNPPPQNQCTHCQSSTNPLGFCAKCTIDFGLSIEICF